MSSSHHDRLCFQFGSNKIRLNIGSDDLYDLYLPEKSNYFLVKQRIYSKKDNDYRPETTVLTAIIDPYTGLTYNGSCGKLTWDELTGSFSAIEYQSSPIFNFVYSYSRKFVQSTEITAVGIKQIDKAGSNKALEDHCLEFAVSNGKDHLQSIASYLQSIKDDNCRKFAARLQNILDSIPDIEGQKKDTGYDPNLYYIVNSDGSIVSSAKKRSDLKADQDQRIVKGSDLN